MNNMMREVIIVMKGAIKEKAMEIKEKVGMIKEKVDEWDTGD